MKLLKSFFVLIILMNLAVSQFVDMIPDSADVEPVDSLKILFQEGVRYYNQERYWDALNVFEKFNEIPESENYLLSATGLMLVKTYLRLGDLDLAIQLGREFVLIHKTSRYRDDVEYALGEAYLIKGLYSESIHHYLNVMQSTDEQRLRYLSKQTLETIIDLFVSTEQLLTIIENTHEDFHPGAKGVARGQRDDQGALFQQRICADQRAAEKPCSGEGLYWSYSASQRVNGADWQQYFEWSALCR